ncbi:MAG: AAA family ATPase, partial [Clostridiales bacterium]|nr:AAA family ATPase [Clostridiales bacterium]
MQTGFKEDFIRIESEIKNAVVGQREIIRNILVAMIAGGNILLEGLPGLGKTQMVKAIGRALDMGFSRIQFTPDLMPADVTGATIYHKDRGFDFQKGPLFSNIVLADEINRATPKTQ